MTAKKGPGEIRRAPIAARMSLRARLARSLVRRILGPKLRDDVPLEDQRAFADRLARASRMPRGVTLRCADAGGVACEALAANGIGATAPRIVYLHGGAYCIGSPAGHRSLTAYLAGACQAEVVVPDYRLAPEHPFPAALDDAGAAWQAIRERHPDAPLVLAGDSAGGGLAVALTVSLRDAGQRLPDALALLSPWCELSEITETYASREHAEVMLTAGWLRFLVRPCATRWSGIFDG